MNFKNNWVLVFATVYVTARLPIYINILETNVVYMYMWNNLVLLNLVWSLMVNE